MTADERKTASAIMSQVVDLSAAAYAQAVKNDGRAKPDRNKVCNLILAYSKLLKLNLTIDKKDCLTVLLGVAVDKKGNNIKIPSSAVVLGNIDALFANKLASRDAAIMVGKTEYKVEPKKSSKTDAEKTVA